MALTQPRLGQLLTNVAIFTDAITVLHGGATQPNVDVGFVLNRANGLVPNAAFYWSESTQSFVTALTANSGVTDSNISVQSYGNLTVGNLLMVNGSVLNVVGNIYANVVGTGTNYFGNITVTGTETVGNLITTNGVFWANGVNALAPTYGNTQVAAYLPTYTGNVTASNIITSTAVYSPAYFYANGTPFTSSNYGNAQVLANLAATSNPITIGSALTVGSSTNSTGLGTGAFTVTQGGASIYQDLWVGGNIYANVLNTVSTQILQVNDPLLYLYSSTTYPYNYEIGMYSHFVGGPANVYAHTGLVRNHLDNTWYLFSNVPEPSGNTINLNSTNIVYDTLKLGNIISTGNITTTNGVFWANGVSALTSAYGNTQVAQYLPAYTGNISAGNITVTGIETVGNLITTNGVYWANGTPYSSGSSSGSVNPAIYLGRTIATTAPTLIDSIPFAGNTSVSWKTTSYDSVYNQYRISTIDTINNGTTVNYTEYGVLLSNTGTTVTTFTSNITGSNVALWATGNTSSVAVTYERTTLGSATTTGYFNVGPAGASGTTGNIVGATNGNAYITGSLIPTSNVAYDLGTTTQRFRSLYLSGNTIDLGGASIKTDATTGAIAFVPQPTTANPNPVATIVSPTGTITTAATTGGNIDATTFSTSSNNASTVTSFGNITVANIGNIGNVITTNGVFWANGVNALAPTYGNTQVAAYLPTNPTVTAIQANTGAYQTWANANVAGLSSQIISANTAVVSYVNTGLNSLATGANANTAAYLNTYNGNVRAGNVTATLYGNTVGTTATYSGSITAGVVPRTSTIADGTSLSFNIDTADLFIHTNTQATGTLTVNAPTGTPLNGQKFIIRITTTSVQTFSWNAIYVGSTDLTLPSASTGSGKYDYMGFIYNSTAAKWHFIAKTFGY